MIRFGGWIAATVGVILLTPTLIGLAYQIRPTLDLTIGDETLDKGVVRDFYADERREGDGLRFRWTRGASQVALPAWGPGPYQLAIEMGAPLNPEPVVRLLINDQLLGETRLTGDFRRYTFEVPTSLVSAGDITLTWQSATFSPPGDRRRLGVVIHRVELTPLGTWPVTPPSRALASGMGLVILFFAALAVAGWGARAAFGGAAGLAAAVAGLLAANRLLIVPVLDQLVVIGGIALGGVALTRLLLAGLARRPGWRLGREEQAWLLTLVAVTLLIRLAATMHPQMDIIDLGFHVNRYTDVAERGILFLKIRSAEWGGRETTYSPAAYLAMIPLGWLEADKHRMIRLFNVLLETSRLLLVFGLARWLSRSGRAALIAALLFVSLPQAILPFSWGISSNLFGEWWATALLAILAVGWRHLARPAGLALATLVAALALLSHPGLLLLTGVWLALLTASLMLAWWWRRGQRQTPPAEPAGAAVARLALVTVLAMALAFGAFYRVEAAAMLTQGGATIAQRLSGEAATSDQPRRWRVSGSVDDKSLGLGARYVTDLAQVPLAGAIGYAREAWAYYWGWPLIAALAGWWLIGGDERGRHVRRLVLAWAITAGLFAIVGLLLNLYVRYMLFLLPVICLLAGVALDTLARRSRWGAGLCLALLTATVLAGLWFWHQRIVYFFH